MSLVNCRLGLIHLGVLQKGLSAPELSLRGAGNPKLQVRCERCKCTSRVGIVAGFCQRFVADAAAHDGGAAQVVLLPLAWAAEEETSTWASLALCSLSQTLTFKGKNCWADGCLEAQLEFLRGMLGPRPCSRYTLGRWCFTHIDTASGCSALMQLVGFEH